jgi:hypothetical protein
LTYRRTANHYLAGLAAACLVALPFIGLGAIVIWLVTAVTMLGLAPRRG